MTHTYHTPGPWTVDLWEIGERKEAQVVVRTGKDCVAYVKDLWAGLNEPFRCDERDSNARLIAAAPDMLEALRSLLARCVMLDQSATHEGLANCNAMSYARQAIAKAEGKA